MSNPTVPGQIELLTPDFNFKGYWDSIIFIVSGHGISKAELPVLAGCNESIDCNFLSTGQEAELLIKKCPWFCGAWKWPLTLFPKLDD